MSNEELKKKIVGIIRTADTSIVIGTNNINIIADALIAAGIGDVKETEAEANRYEMLYSLQSRDMALAERKAYESEHRAARAERALMTVCTNVVKDEEDDVTIEPCARVLYTAYLKQAEQELAEEGNK